MSKKIIVEKEPTEQQLAAAKGWSIWTSPVTTFDWEYSVTETCYIIEGEVIIHTKDGDTKIESGDLVTFPKGLKCVWQVVKAVKKYYTFS